MTFQCPVPVGAVFAGKYRVDRLLGEGGMGIVVAAHHLELDQTVAVKFLLDDVAKNAEGAERFRREARAAAKIQSDHVVRVLDVGLLESGERYMVMEYLDGHDLAEELRIHGTLPADVAVRYLLEALDAIAQAHAHGIVHRDLKPANLYLAKRLDGSSRVKVLDFGISKSMSQSTGEQLSLTRTSAWIGSPLYMAPEQMQSARDVDLRADIWSLGAILYELVSGQPPYPAESLPQLCNLMLTRDPQPLIELCPDVPAELNECVMRCLTRSLEQRFQTANELRSALSALAPGRTTRSSAVGLAKTDVVTGQGAPSNAAAAVGVTNGDASASQSGALPERTAAAWGGTGSGDAGSRRTLWVGLSAAALIGVGAVVFLSRAPEAVPTVAGAESAPAQASPPAVPPPVAPTPSAAPPAAPEVAPLVAPSAPSTPPDASAAAAPAASSDPAKPHAAKPISAKKPGPAAPKAAAPQPAAPADGISDFGGRR